MLDHQASNNLGTRVKKGLVDRNGKRMGEEVTVIMWTFCSPHENNGSGSLSAQNVL